MPDFFQDAVESLERYKRWAESCKERWKSDHDEAMQCLELEEVLVFGMAVYHHINRMDEVWRLSVHRKRTAFDPKVERLIMKLYRVWLRVYTVLGKMLRGFEDAGYDVAGAEEFRAMCREIRGILTPDEKFFTDEAFFQMEDSALRLHRAGKTIQIGSLSD